MKMKMVSYMDGQLYPAGIKEFSPSRIRLKIKWGIVSTMEKDYEKSRKRQEEEIITKKIMTKQYLHRMRI